MPLPSIITIDGPAASGKSTLGKWLADDLGYLFFDTGVMYRAITWAALEKGIKINREEEISKLAEETNIDVRPPSVLDSRNCDIFVDNQDITWEIRRREVEQNVSQVSAYERVRSALSAQQRRIGLRGRVVMVGRDIGTVVLPEAEMKIFLVASATERARRRYTEKISRGETADFSEILKGIRDRDEYDSDREFAPLRAAPDAIILDTDRQNAQEAYEQLYRLVMEQANQDPI